MRYLLAEIVESRRSSKESVSLQGKGPFDHLFFLCDPLPVQFRNFDIVSSEVLPYRLNFSGKTCRTKDVEGFESGCVSSLTAELPDPKNWRGKENRRTLGKPYGARCSKCIKLHSQMQSLQ